MFCWKARTDSAKHPTCLGPLCPLTRPAEPRYTMPLQTVDPDQLASEEANWSGSALFVIKYVNLEQSSSSNLIGWKLEVGMAS